MALPFVGPSYTLATRKASVQRTVNMHLVPMETAEKARFILDSVPGLILWATLGAAVRGAFNADGRCFAVAGSTLYELSSNGTSTNRGTLATSTGVVDFAYGLTQLVMVDGANGYVLTLSTNAFAQITDADFAGATRVAFLDNYFIFSGNNGQQYQVTGINDATTIDGLDFASAESQPDDIVGHIVLQDDLVLFGELTTEFHGNLGASDFPFERHKGVGQQIGLAAVHSAQSIDNGIYWIGKDKNGAGIVYRMEGRGPRRISTQAVEQALQASTDLSAAWAYCWQENGLTFYAINAPGLTSTWVYEVSVGQWFEMAELGALGQFEAHRGTCHVYAFGKHLVGADDGKLYQMSRTTYQNAGDALVRERTSPHEAVPGRVRLFFKPFFLDATTGEAAQGDDPQVELSYSDDSGASWSNAMLRSLGRVGERFARLVWNRLGASRDRIWKVRFSGNAPFAIVDAGADADVGTN